MKAILVEEVYKLHGVASLTMAEDSLLEDIIGTFADDPGLRAIFLVDLDGRFVGEITQVELIKWVQLQLYGASDVMWRHKGSAMGRGMSAWEVSYLVSATKARELRYGTYRYLGIRENDTLQNALDKMIRYRTDILPVIDYQGRILGDLRLSEVLLKTVEVGGKGRTKP